MIDVATPQMKRPRCSEKPRLPLRAQTDIGLKTKSKPARTGPVLPFLDEFTPEQAQESIDAHLPDRPGKKKRCWSANF